ncbi:MAG: cache domain-containing protein [Oligoflexia bacterium]|nr:cache domain-containing protein [Oligoflexia bacterium]
MIRTISFLPALFTLFTSFISMISFITIAYSSTDVIKKAEEDAMKLVNDTAIEFSSSSQNVIEKINNGIHPYKNKDNAEAYVFIYDENINIVAHPKNELVNKNFKDKTDICGCKFRNEIVARALNKNFGDSGCREINETSKKDNWVYYIYNNPQSKKLEYKKTFFKSVKGIDGKEYVIASGIYLQEIRGCPKNNK